MFTQSKKGFTLIELMVVIVIIGILAAVAIPKLFGMNAKAKASEVGAAAGTWSKLQQAYFMEKDNVGTIKRIGFDAPGKDKKDTDCDAGKTQAFCYTGLEDDDKAGQFNANPNVKLNDCTTTMSWNLTYVVTDGADGKALTKGGSVSEDCQILTPNFCLIADMKDFAGTACADAATP